ncbi:MAG: hypothetical protein ACREUT_00950 [Steroidobacteraceae bacterium]
MLGTLAVTAAASLVMLGGTGSTALAAHGGGGHGGGHGGGFHGGGLHGGGFHGGGFRGGGFRGRGPRGGYGYRGYRGYRGFGYGGFAGYGDGWGFDPWWGIGLGFYEPMLPWYYSTFWWDGVPYYYGDDGFFVWNGDQGQYEQVQPPSEIAEQAENGQLTQTPTKLFAYPKNGQSLQRQALDKSECSLWASGQTGVHPATGAAGNANQPTSAQQEPSAQQEQNYLRAEDACLTARGYAVD